MQKTEGLIPPSSLEHTADIVFDIAPFVWDIYEVVDDSDGQIYMMAMSVKVLRLVNRTRHIIFYIEKT